MSITRSPGRARQPVDRIRNRIEAGRAGNPLDEAGLWIARLDMLSRNEDRQAQTLPPRSDLLLSISVLCPSRGGAVR